MEAVSTLLDELYLIGTLTDDHDTEYDGGHYITPSLIDHDDGKENSARENPQYQA